MVPISDDGITVILFPTTVAWASEVFPNLVKFYGDRESTLLAGFSVEEVACETVKSTQRGFKSELQTVS